MFSSNTHILLRVLGRLASFISILVMRRFFANNTKILFNAGCVQGFTVSLVCLFVCLSVCLSVCLLVSVYYSGVCVTFVFCPNCESCTRPADFHKLGIYGNGQVWGKVYDVFCRTLSRVGRCCGFRGVFRVLRKCFFWFLSTNAHGLLQV